MKKLIAMLVLAAVVITGTIGCGGSATTAPKKAETPPVADKGK